MSSNMHNICSYCSKECKPSDSKPFPTSKSKDRIHFKCHVKKSITEKQQKKESNSGSSEVLTIKPKCSLDLMSRSVDERKRQESVANEKKMSKMIQDEAKQSDESRSTFFFDLKAGIAKPHEKRRYLHHRNLSEIGSRYNDQGFQEESVGRAYDHTGKDLMTIEGDSDCSNDEAESRRELANEKRGAKRASASASDNIEGSFKRKRKVKSIQVDEKNPCWFCLSSPNVEKHLIISVGEQFYITLAKGGLVDEHFLIIPIEHIQSSNSEQHTEDQLNELERFKKSIIEYFRDQSLGTVFFERNFRSVHYQMQAVPVPITTLDDLPLRIKTISKNHHGGLEYIDLPKDCTIRDLVPANAPYFYWQVEPNGIRFVCQLQIGKGEPLFPIQFGRIVLSNQAILNCPDRVDWKSCVKTSGEYAEMVKLIKEKYRPYEID